MKLRSLLACLAASALVIAALPAHAAPPEHVVSIVLVLRPQTPGATAQAFVAENVPVGRGPELRGVCDRGCTDFGHPTVDIDLAAQTVSVMVPGSEHQLTDAELLVTTDLITGFAGLDSPRARSVDTRRAELTPDGARMTWTSYTAFAPATVVFDIETAHDEAPPAPVAPRSQSLPSGEAAAVTEPAPLLPAEPSRSIPAESAQPVLAQPTFTG